MFQKFLGVVLNSDKKEKKGIYGRVWFSSNPFRTILVVAIASHSAVAKTGGIAPVPLAFSKEFTKGVVYHSALSEIPSDIPKEASSSMQYKIHIYGRALLFGILVILIVEEKINKSIAQYLGLDLYKFIDVFEKLTKMDTAGRVILQSMMEKQRFKLALESANRLLMKHMMLVFLVHIALNSSILILMEFQGVLYHFSMNPLSSRLYFTFEDPEIKSQHIMQVVLIEYMLNNFLFTIIYLAAISRIVIAVASFALFFAGEFWRKSGFSRESRKGALKIPGVLRLFIITEIDESRSFL